MMLRFVLPCAGLFLAAFILFLVLGILKKKALYFAISGASAAVLVIGWFSLLSFVTSMGSEPELIELTTMDNGEYVAILWEDRTYVPFCPIDPRVQGEQLGYIDGDPKDKVYAVFDLAPEEWLISRYESGEMDISMLMRELSVTALPDELKGYESEYEWNRALFAEEAVTRTEELTRRYPDGSEANYELTWTGEALHVNAKVYDTTGAYGEPNALLSEEDYNAVDWREEDGWIFFEEYRMPGYDGPSGHTALRVTPLDETYQELTDTYLTPLGYSWNNVFIQDWDEDSVKSLDFYDLFDVFYPVVSGQWSYSNTPTEIPAEVFENIVTRWFPVSPEALRECCDFLPEQNSYAYRPRGVEDAEPPNYPTPEVRSFTENEDGTLTLTVYAVFPEKNTARYFSHAVTVRPTEDGFQYVGNQILSPTDFTPIWRVERAAS